MMPLVTRSAAGSPDESLPHRNRLRDAAAGAAAGLLLWIAAMLLGIPQLAGFDGHHFTIPAAVIGAGVAFTRLRTWMYVKTAIVLVLVAIVAYTPLMEGPVRSLVRHDRPLPGSAPAGAVVVLSADITTDSLLGTQGLDRLLSGIAQLKAGAAPRLVVTRNEMRTRGRRIPSTPDQRWILALAEVDPARVQVVDSVHSTRDEAVRAWNILAPQGIRRIVLVTSPVHSGRACRAFQRVGFAVVCAPSISRDVPLAPGALYRPADRLAAFRLWLYEQAAFALYHLQGWI